MSPHLRNAFSREGEKEREVRGGEEGRKGREREGRGAIASHYLAVAEFGSL